MVRQHIPPQRMPPQRMPHKRTARHAARGILHAHGTPPAEIPHAMWWWPTMRCSRLPDAPLRLCVRFIAHCPMQCCMTQHSGHVHCTPHRPVDATQHTMHSAPPEARRAHLAAVGTCRKAHAKWWLFCLLVCLFTDSGSRGGAALLRMEPTLPEGSKLPRAGRRDP